ncbi:hypothetical protein [Streptomyces guryensis]|nr:hypothetical protein [Streptomyces guryensis]
MPHANAPLSVEGRWRLVKRCQTRPIAPIGLLILIEGGAFGL